MKKIPFKIYLEIQNALDICEMDLDNMPDDKYKKKRLKQVEKAREWLHENCRYSEKQKATKIV